MSHLKVSGKSVTSVGLLQEHYLGHHPLYETLLHTQEDVEDGHS